MLRTTCIGAVVVALAASSACATANGRETARALDLRPCHLDGLKEEIQCGTFQVYEDRQAGRGRQIPIEVTVLPALRLGAAPDPLVILAGGPGQGARSYAVLLARSFTRVRRTRSIVLVDLRGTGDSHPLKCPALADELDGFEWTHGTSEVERCLASLDADPRHYTHAEALADLDDIRRALGIDRVNLWGGSWGTRAALRYALAYGHATRAVVLDGAVPLDLQFPLSASADAARALELLAADCGAEAACAGAFPAFRTDLDAVLARLSHGAATVTLRHPRTGEPSAVTITREAFLAGIRTSLYSPLFAAALPMLVREAARGEFAPMAAHFVHVAGRLSDVTALGATLSILCSEDLPHVAGADFRRAAGASLFGTAYADVWRGRCSRWPRGAEPALDTHATASAAALILSGASDPVTPPRWGDRMAAHFPHSRHIVVPGAAHNASFGGCVPDLIAAFLESGSGDGLDAGCVERVKRPPFVVDRAGTRP